MKGKTLNICEKSLGYSYEGPRFIYLGPFSGEEFREKYFLPWLAEISGQEKAIVDFEGTKMYSPSFLEEGFGGVIREAETKEEAEINRRKLGMVQFDNMDPVWEKKLRGYIANAKHKPKMTQGTGLKEESMKERDRIVIGALKACTARASIEDTFSRYDITDTQERIAKLNGAMGNPRTSFTSGNISQADIYELTLQMFLTMSWKLNSIYDRMGLDQLLDEADAAGIINIDVTGTQLTPEVIREAIAATKQLDAELDKKLIAQKLQKVDSIIAAQYR
jgi:hypothetical protein